jgi:ABC-type dipeptide/oligopeptide/nickel transport system permease subunit
VNLRRAPELIGMVDDIIVFITNLFTVIPSFVLVILIPSVSGRSNVGLLSSPW